MTAAWTPAARVAVALWAEHEPTRDLAAWARGETAPRPHGMCTMGVGCREAGACWAIEEGLAEGCPLVHLQTPVPDPLDVEAYRADCARRGVEPGPLPSLKYDGGSVVRWRVESTVYIEVGDAGLFEAWAVLKDGKVLGFGDGGRQKADVDHLVLLARLAQAAAEAMR